MNMEGIVLSEISQTEKHEYCMVSLTFGIKKKVKLEWWLPRVGDGGNGERLVKGYKLLVIR